jgi:hypothetical protein
LKTRGASGQPCSPARVSQWLRAQCAPDQGTFEQDAGLRPRQVGPAFCPGSIAAAPLVSASRALHGASFVCFRVLRPHARARPCAIHCRAISRDREKASRDPEILQRSPRAKLDSGVAQRFEGHFDSVRVPPTQDGGDFGRLRRAEATDRLRGSISATCSPSQHKQSRLDRARHTVRLHEAQSGGGHGPLCSVSGGTQ